MQRWLLIALLLVNAHFAASYLVPLDPPSQRTFLGLLRWVWPWSDGDYGPLGRLAVGGPIPLAGFFIAVTAGVLLILGTLGLAHLWIPREWARYFVAAGSVALLLVLGLFPGLTKLLPLACAAATLYLALAREDLWRI